MIKLQGVYKEFKFGKEGFVALKDINLEIEKGEFTALLGPSGSGKSTLMYIIGLLDKPTKGKVIFEKKDVKKFNDEKLSQLRNKFIGFVFQQFNLINKLTVLENIVQPSIYARALGFDPQKRAWELMRRFGIDHRAESYPNKISAGEQQRTAIARALINKPKLVLADEPTGNLDTQTGNKILELLEELNKKDKLTILMVTHEMNVAKRAKREINIMDGKIV